MLLTFLVLTFTHLSSKTRAATSRVSGKMEPTIWSRPGLHGCGAETRWPVSHDHNACSNVVSEDVNLVPGGKVRDAGNEVVRMFIDLFSYECKLPIADHVMLSREFFLCLSENYSFAFTRICLNLKGIILKGTIAWYTMGQQTNEAKEVY